ncbi:hypothetical protein [Massilia pseudoviolaceinigra]|uniref:hypothetical protein n=1 Tax=Massilia pseudoviolaceinigra TaxID=3057165 RepID=UPI0027968052|nr:hypothetical protein [Massilia sp. CCM 9206]MDQ1924684.1 hypothetical protein [Massilia sp. CCM 9206]
MLDRLFGREQVAVSIAPMQFNAAAGDTVVLSYSKFLDKEQRDRLKERGLADLPDGVKVLLLEGGIEMRVVNRTDCSSRILAQLETQTEIMAANAKKADRDSQLYQESLKTYTEIGTVTRTSTHNPVCG